jgi:uncharacterized protein YndB with AHSA1/START domain
MAEPQRKQDTVLQIRRSYNAARAAVFRAWTDPQALKIWFAPSDAMTTPVAEVDLRVGGRYRIEMLSAEGKRHCVRGEYLEVQTPKKLVFTWAWERDELETGDTVVTVEFLERGATTEVVLTHERFASAKARDAHHDGWTGCLDRLPKALST